VRRLLAQAMQERWIEPSSPAASSALSCEAGRPTGPRRDAQIWTRTSGRVARGGLLDPAVRKPMDLEQVPHGPECRYARRSNTGTRRHQGAYSDAHRGPRASGRATRQLIEAMVGVRGPALMLPPTWSCAHALTATTAIRSKQPPSRHDRNLRRGAVRGTPMRASFRARR
jgi:hypothetical protein